METKVCRICTQEKSVEDFRWKIKAKNVRHDWCRPCASKRKKELYDPDNERRIRANALANRRAKVLEGWCQLPSSKVCSDCSEEKPIEDFRWRDQSLGIRLGRCSRCDRNWRARDYRNKSESYRARIDRLHAELRAIVEEAKKPPCMDCGVSYPPYVMDFDHRDPTQKVSKVSNLMRLGSREKLIAELSKCDLVCANCHRKRTHKQRQT